MLSARATPSGPLRAFRKSRNSAGDGMEVFPDVGTNAPPHEGVLQNGEACPLPTSPGAHPSNQMLASSDSARMMPRTRNDTGTSVRSVCGEAIHGLVRNRSGAFTHGGGGSDRARQ